VKEEEEEIDLEDYTKTTDLKKLFGHHEKPKDHILVLEQLIGLSVNEFFEEFLSDNTKNGLKQFYERKGENDVTCDQWHEPVDP
jgi:hypothetical protein